MNKQPTPYMQMKHLKSELRYAQMQARIDARNLIAARAKVKEIAAKMRILASKDQAEICREMAAQTIVSPLWLFKWQMENTMSNDVHDHSAALEEAAQNWEVAAEAVLAGDDTVVCDYETCLAHAAECRELAAEE